MRHDGPNRASAVQLSAPERQIARTYPLLAGSGSLYGDCVRSDSSEVHQSGRPLACVVTMDRDRP
jgi:hypothetical protein